MSGESGDVIGNYQYTTQVYPTNVSSHREQLFSPKGFFYRLDKIYIDLKVTRKERSVMDVWINLPENERPKLRKKWYKTVAGKMERYVSMRDIEKLSEDIGDSFVLATVDLMNTLDIQFGEKMIVAPAIPAPTTLC